MLTLAEAIPSVHNRKEQIFIKIYDLKSIFYKLAALAFFIPVCIALATNIVFSDFWIHLSLNSALFLFLVGKLLSILKKRKAEENITLDVGFFLGILLVLFSNIIKQLT